MSGCSVLHLDTTTLWYQKHANCKIFLCSFVTVILLLYYFELDDAHPTVRAGWITFHCLRFSMTNVDIQGSWCRLCIVSFAYCLFSISQHAWFQSNYQAWLEEIMHRVHTTSTCMSAAFQKKVCCCMCSTKCKCNTLYWNAAKDEQAQGSSLPDWGWLFCSMYRIGRNCITYKSIILMALLLYIKLYTGRASGRWHFEYEAPGWWKHGRTGIWKQSMMLWKSEKHLKKSGSIRTSQSQLNAI